MVLTSTCSKFLRSQCLLWHLSNIVAKHVIEPNLEPYVLCMLSTDHVTFHWCKITRKIHGVDMPDVSKTWKRLKNNKKGNMKTFCPCWKTNICRPSNLHLFYKNFETEGPRISMNSWHAEFNFSGITEWNKCQNLFPPGYKVFRVCKSGTQHRSKFRRHPLHILLQKKCAWLCVGENVC